MARPLRLEFAGALYHVTSRGDHREAIFLDDGDRQSFLELLGQVCARFNWTIHAFCLMGNHLLLETPDGNLSLGEPGSPAFRRAGFGLCYNPTLNLETAVDRSVWPATH